MGKPICALAAALVGAACSRRPTPEPSPPVVMSSAPREFVVTVGVVGGGAGSVHGAGIDRSSSCEARLGEGTRLSLTADPAPGSHVTGWSIGGCTGTSCELTIDRDLHVAATFERDAPVGTPDVPPMATGLCSTDGWCWENPTPQGNRVASVWVRAPDDVWGAGEGGTVLRYDGRQWARMPLDAGRDIDEDVYALWGGSASDVWAVGDAGHVHHFDGKSWSRVDLGTNTPFFDVRGGPGGDVWIAGAAGALLRFEDGRWTQLPKVADLDLRAVFPAGPGQTWVAVGRNWDQGRLLRGDGYEWTVARSAPTPIGIWASGPDDLWAGGLACSFCALPARWDGHSWTEFGATSSGATIDAMAAIGGSEPGHPWMISYSGVTRFDGSTWSTPFWPQWRPSALAVAPHDQVWLGFGNGAIGRLDGARAEAIFSDAVTLAWSRSSARPCRSSPPIGRSTPCGACPATTCGPSEASTTRQAA